MGGGHRKVGGGVSAWEWARVAARSVIVKQVPGPVAAIIFKHGRLGCAQVCQPPPLSTLSLFYKSKGFTRIFFKTGMNTRVSGRKSLQ